MPSFLSKVFGRKHHDKSEEASPLSPGELLEGRFEAISPNVSPTATRFLELDANGKPLGGDSGVPIKGTGKDKDTVFGLFKAKSRPSSPEVQHKRLLDTLPHLKLDFEPSKGDTATSNVGGLFNDIQADSLLSETVIGQRRLNPIEALLLIRACSKAITARGLETLGIMTPHWYSTSPEIQRRLISQFLNASASSPAPHTALSPTSASPVSSFEDELTFTRSPHDVAAVLRWGLRHLQLDNNTFGSSEDWYQSFLSSEASSNWPPKAFSEQLAVKVPANHLELLVATLEIVSSLAAFSETNSTSGSKLSKIFGLWLLASTRVKDEDDWRTFYNRWENTGRMLEHLFLARIRDESTDRRMPVRLLELVRKYPYTQGLSPPTTDQHIALPPRPHFSTLTHDALYVRIVYELPTAGTTRSRKKHRIHPSTLIADAFSGRLQHDTEIEVTYASRADFVELWEKITMAAQRTGTEAPLSSVFADDTIRLLALVSNRRKEHSKTPAFALLSSIAAQSPVAELKVTEPTPTLSPLGLNLKTNGRSHHFDTTTNGAPQANGSNGIGSSWERFSTSGFLESSVPPLASTLFDTDVERTEPPERVEHAPTLQRKLSKGRRKSGEVPRLAAPPMEVTNSSSSGQSLQVTDADGERNVKLRYAVKPTQMSIIQLDEAFVDFWSDALLDPISADWPTFVICKFKTGLVNELAFGSEKKADEEVTTPKVESSDTASTEGQTKADETGKGRDKKDTKRTLKYLVLEQAYTVRQPATTTTATAAVPIAPGLKTATSSSESAGSPTSPLSASARKRFSFWNTMSRSPSSSSVASAKARKSFAGTSGKTPKVGEMGELGEVVEEEGDGSKDKGKQKDKDTGKAKTPGSTPPKKKRRSFDLSELGLKIGKDKEPKEETKAKVEAVPPTIEEAKEEPSVNGSTAAKVAGGAVSAAAVSGAVAAGLAGPSISEVATENAKEDAAPEATKPTVDTETDIEPVAEPVEGDVTPKQETFNASVEEAVEEAPALVEAPAATVTQGVELATEDPEPSAATGEMPAEKEDVKPATAVEDTKPEPEIVEYKNLPPSATSPQPVEEPGTQSVATDPPQFEPSISIISEPPTGEEIEATKLAAAYQEDSSTIPKQEPGTPSITVHSVVPKPVDDEQEDAGKLVQTSTPPLEPESVAPVVPENVVSASEPPFEALVSPQEPTVEVDATQAVAAAPEHTQDVEESEPTVGVVQAAEPTVDTTVEEPFAEPLVEPEVAAIEPSESIAQETGTADADLETAGDEVPVKAQPDEEASTVQEVIVENVQQHPVEEETSIEAPGPVQQPAEVTLPVEETPETIVEETAIEEGIDSEHIPPPPAEEETASRAILEAAPLPQAEGPPATEEPAPERPHSPVAEILDRENASPLSNGPGADTQETLSQSLESDANVIIADVPIEQPVPEKAQVGDEANAVPTLDDVASAAEPEDIAAGTVAAPEVVADETGAQDQVIEEKLPNDPVETEAGLVDSTLLPDERVTTAEESGETQSTEPEPAANEPEGVVNPIATEASEAHDGDADKEETPVVENDVTLPHDAAEPSPETSTASGTEPIAQSAPVHSDDAVEGVDSSAVTPVFADGQEGASAEVEVEAPKTVESISEVVESVSPQMEESNPPVDDIPEQPAAKAPSEENIVETNVEAEAAPVVEHHGEQSPLDIEDDAPQESTAADEATSQAVESSVSPPDEDPSPIQEDLEVTAIEGQQELSSLHSEPDVDEELPQAPQEVFSATDTATTENVDDNASPIQEESIPPVEEVTQEGEVHTGVVAPAPAEDDTIEADIQVEPLLNAEHPAEPEDAPLEPITASEATVESSLSRENQPLPQESIETAPVEETPSLHSQPVPDEEHSVTQEESLPTTDAIPALVVDSSPIEPSTESTGDSAETGEVESVVAQDAAVAEAEKPHVDVEPETTQEPAPEGVDLAPAPAQHSDEIKLASPHVSSDAQETQAEEPTNVVSSEPHTEPIAIPDETSKEALVDLSPIPVVEAPPAIEQVDTITVPLPEQPSAQEPASEDAPSAEHSEAAALILESGSTPGPQLALSTEDPSKDNGEDHPEHDIVVANEETLLAEPPVPIVETTQEEVPEEPLKEVESIVDATIGEDEKSAVVEDAVPSTADETSATAVHNAAADDAHEDANEDANIPPKVEVADLPHEQEGQEQPEPESLTENPAVPDDGDAPPQEVELTAAEGEPDETQHAKGGTEESDQTIAITESHDQPDIKAEEPTNEVKHVDIHPSILVEED